VKPIFINHGAKSAKAFFLIALALVFMHFDLRSSSFHRWRNTAEVLIYPLQWAVNVPHHVLSWASSTFASHQQLLDENAALRAQQLLLFARLQKMLILEQENTELRELLKSSTTVSGKTIAAELLALSQDPAEQVIIVNRGRRDKVFAGQPVLDAFGIVGQVIDVTPLTSKVMLLTDARSAVPVQNSRNGLRAIAMGLGAEDRLALKNVPDTSDVKVGDIFVASGLGSRFPLGYPVGKVIFVGKSQDARFTKIVLAPLAHLNRATQVLLLSEDAHA
jgi:rod shape-determining protein MreC